MIDNYKQNRFVKIKENQYISDFICDNDLSNSFVLENFSLFDDCLCSLEICEKCSGLETCKQSKKGEVVGLEYNFILANNISYCDKYKDVLNKEKTIKSYVYSNVPEIHAALTLKNIPLEDEKLKELYYHCNQILTGDRSKGLYIYGDLGVGKTYMSIALANSLVLKNKKVSFIKVNDFVTQMATLSRTNPEKYEDVISRIKKCDYVFLDDIGAEIVTEFVRDRLLSDLLDYRMENKLVTLFTSNLDKNSLLKHYSNDTQSLKARRLMERIDILSDNYCLVGKNKRRANG